MGRWHVRTEECQTILMACVQSQGDRAKKSLGIKSYKDGEKLALASICCLLIKPDVSMSPLTALAMLTTLTILTTLQGGKASLICEGEGQIEVCEGCLGGWTYTTYTHPLCVCLRPNDQRCINHLWS